MTRSFMAVVAGYLVVAATSIGWFAILNALIPGAFPEPKGGPPPSSGVRIAVLIGHFVFSAAGAYAAAAIARRAEIAHAIALGLLLTVLGGANLIMMWGREPLWFQFALVAFPLPATVLGGNLRAKRTSPAG
jgi:hypothetical protein